MVRDKKGGYVSGRGLSLMREKKGGYVCGWGLSLIREDRRFCMFMGVVFDER